MSSAAVIFGTRNKLLKLFWEIKNFIQWRQGDGSVGNVPAVWAWGPEFNPLHLYQTLDMVPEVACKPSIVEVKTGVSLGLWISKLQIQWETLSPPNKVDISWGGMTRKAILWNLHTCTHKCMHTDTQIHIHMHTSYLREYLIPLWEFLLLLSLFHSPRDL